MRPFRFRPQLRLAPVLALVVVGLAASGCAAVSPLATPAPADGAPSWTSSPRAAVATTRRPERTTARPERAPTTRRPRPAAVEAEPAPVEAAPTRRARPVVRAEAPFLAGASAVDATLRDEAPDWIGIPYRFGGETRSGIDCSAFTRAFLREAFDLALPRNTALQVQEGAPVGRDELRAGDLVFFRRGGTRHVGVYLSDGEFIHASTSRGVTISRLEESYFARYYWTARRVLGPTPTLLADASRRPRSRVDRVEDALARFAEGDADFSPARLDLPLDADSTAGW